MWPVTANLLTWVRNTGSFEAVATHKNLATGASTVLNIEDGSVTVDRSSNVRRTLNLTLPPEQATWDLLDTPGGEITVLFKVIYLDHTTETVPLGVFIVDQSQLGYSPGDSITITAPDRWVKVQRNRFSPTGRSSVPGNTAWQEIQRLVEGAWPGTTYPFPGWASLDTTATDKVGVQLWDDGDREGAINAMVEQNALDVFFDAQGKAVLRPLPQLTTTSRPVWTVNAGDQGVMIGADTARDWSRTYNAVIATTTAADVIFNPVERKNTTAGDPLNVTGTLGYVPYPLEGNFRNSTQADKAALAKLSIVLGQAKTVSLEAVPNPALADGDVISVVFPWTDRFNPRPLTELHIIDSVTIPLTPQGTQTIQTRSTRPDTDGT